MATEKVDFFFHKKKKHTLFVSICLRPKKTNEYVKISKHFNKKKNKGEYPISL